MVSAFKIGGTWDTNSPAWVVEVGDTNESSLNIDVDRSLLTNNALMRLDYVDHSNAILMLDLYEFTGTNDPNEPVFTSNLFNNLISGGGGVTSRTFTIPFSLYTNVVGIRLRRDAGAMTVFDTLLSSDRDGDGYADSEELAWGSDPDSVLSVPCAAITGQVFYAGVQSGVIHVLAATNANDWASAYYLTMSLPLASHVAPFAISGLPLRRPYYARAWRDVNDNQTKDYWEPSGTAVPVSLYLGSNTGDVVIVMSDPDSDGDGMSDADELMLGMDPLTSNTYARLPFIECFETNTVHLGDINGQNHWLATPGTALVQTNTVWEGAQALAIKSGDTPANVRQLFAVTNAPVVWIDTRVQATEASAPTNDVSGSALMFFDANGYLKAYDGLRVSSNKWVALTNVPSCGTTGAWVRLTTKLDYSTQRWLVCVDGVMAAEGLGFATPVSQFTLVSFVGGQSGVDALSVSTNKPAGLSLDGDRMPDDWEQMNFGNLGETDSGDVDGDGLSNLQEYLHETDPNVPDSDLDGMSDGWEIVHGFNPNNPADAALDADGDGLSNLGECAAGTDPRNAASHCWGISGRVDYAGMQTGMIWIAACTSPTGWTVVGQTANVSTGEYTITNLPPGSNYWVKAWRDTDGNGSNDSWEAWGAYTNHSITLFTNVAGINFSLFDPDSDGDGMPDWWEIAHGFNPTNAMDAFLDADGDGLNNRAEYQHGTDPHLADTDHDGVNDGTEVQSGSNPKVVNSFAQFPFLERFETNTVHLGDVNGQNGWISTSSNTVLVQTGIVWEGEQALSIKSGDTPASVCQLFAVTNAPVVWIDTHVQATEAAAPTNGVSGSAMMFFDADGHLKAYDGLSVASNKWVTLTNVPSCGTTGAWVRLTTKLDYSTQRWLVCVDGILAAEGLGFATPVSRFTAVSFVGGQSRVDALSVSTNEPSGLSLDGDLMPDDWERTNFGNLVQMDNGDADNDGASNLDEYRRGTDPSAPDTDHDGMADGWEIAHGFNPTNATDAALDSDGDGLTNLAEYQHGTDPLVTDTDHDGVSDGVEVNTWHSNPVAVDSDGDGYKDGDEVERGTDPADPESHPASHWRNHLKLVFREGTITNRLTDVPVLVRLTPERVDYSQCAADGRDILFTDAAGSPLAFEVEKWTPGGESLFWVRLPEAGGTNSADHFWFHSNYPEATNAANAAGVWATNYLGVWHLAETNAVLSDSTPGTYAATNVGAVCVTGILGNARNFRGSDSVIVPPAALATISNAVSISFWQFGATNQPLSVTCFEGTTAIGRELNAHVPWGDSNVYWDAFGNYDRINKLATTNLFKGGWNHWTFTKDRSTGTMRIYVNGELWHSGTGKTRAYSPVTAFRFGGAAGGSSGYVGMLDEFRVESVAQTPEWVRFQYKAMLDQVLIYGEQQVSIAGTGNGAEPDQAGEFTVTRTIQNTNFALLVNLTVSGGTATEGADFTTLPRSVLIPSGATQATLPVPVIDDLWLEGTETVTVAIAQGNYFVNSTNAAASIAIFNDDVDSDNDGLCDVWEIQNFGNLDATPTGDADSDGVNNLQEYLHGTNPHAGDTDQDDLPDQWEIAIGTDPLTPDADADPDNDGLTNLQECQLVTNPKSSDTDGDGMPDGWEVAHGLNPLVNDAALDPDSDGLTNLQECQRGTDPYSPDTDGDGLSDGTEVNVSHTNPLNPDTDGDGLPDKWEVDNGTNPLVNDSAADPDGDNLTNMQEYQLGTNPRVADTDGDGIVDGEEVQAGLSDPLVADFTGAAVNVASLDGSMTNAVLGQWEAQDGELRAVSRRGAAEYLMLVPTAGVYRIEVEACQGNANANWNSFKLIAHVDGVYAGKTAMMAPYVTNGLAHFLTPFLASGEHRVRVDWDNVLDDPKLNIIAVRLQSLDGPDTDGNGVADWLDRRIALTCSLDTANRTSIVSPVCLEGRGLYPELMALSSGAVTGAVPVKPLEGGRWYADVPLCNTGATPVLVSFQNGYVALSNEVEWIPLNLLDATNQVIRRGDAVKFTAAPDGVVTGDVAISVNGIQPYHTTPNVPAVFTFATAGVYTVSGCYNGDVMTSNAITVKVLGGGLPTNEPVCWWGMSRTWDATALPAEAVLDSGSDLVVTNVSNLSSGRRIALILNEGDASHYVTARAGINGPVLDSRRVLGMWVRREPDGKYFAFETLPDGSQVSNIRINTGYFPASARLQVSIFAGGNVFEDGTKVKSLTKESFDALGECVLPLIRPPGASASFCHYCYVYEGQTQVGVR